MYAIRSYYGITVDNTDAANPVVDIASTYTGQNTITTVGTIGSGTWNGDIIDGEHGGTGVDNGTNTISVGGNLSTSEAFTTAGGHAITLTTTGATGVTLPTTGTLATLAETETFTNKTIDADDNTLLNLTNANLSGSAGITNANLANSSVTIGSTSISLGSSSTTLAGLTSVTSTDFIGDLTGDVTGDLSGNATTVTTNANLTGPITSTGNTTAVASQTGTGSTFVMNTSPALVTPDIGVATGTSLSVTGGITSSGSAGIGYTTGSGSTVTQTVNKNNTVVITSYSIHYTKLYESLASTVVLFT